MKDRNTDTGNGNVYRHKLNMLHPGGVMMAVTLILTGIGLIFYFFQLRIVYIALWALAAAVFLVLLILVAIELHQDRVNYEAAKRYDKDIK